MNENENMNVEQQETENQVKEIGFGELLLGGVLIYGICEAGKFVGKKVVKGAKKAIAKAKTKKEKAEPEEEVSEEE